MKKGILNSITGSLKSKCKDPEFLCNVADTIVDTVSKSKSISSKKLEKDSTDKIDRYCALHKRVMGFINKNRKEGNYPKSPIDKDKDVIIVENEAKKVLKDKDYDLYLKYYNWFHGGNGKKMSNEDDLFKAIPTKK